EVFRRNPQSQKTEKVKMSDYGGLFNRSKNSWNLKISYDNFKSGTSLSARLIYKGRYGFADNNGNGILDVSSEYAKGYALINLSASQKLNKHLTIQVGCNDLTNFTDAQHAAGIAGRLFYASLFYSLF
ncbi:MAG: TonB-dependent receptor, partial [Bacteroidota bacterium]|nr:TonB-dependent receptor [Bacteroidota bacterium]